MIINKYKLIAITAIIYAFALGKYKVFPYEYVWSLKNYTFNAIGLGSPSSYLTPEYSLKKSLYDEFRTDSPIIMLGDSLIEYGTWSDMLPIKHLSNRGIAGDTTDGLINRLDQINTKTTKKIVLMIGTNDLNSTNDLSKIKENYKNILSFFHKNRIKVLATSILYVNRSNYLKNEKITRINDFIKSNCNDGMCEYLNINELLGNHGYMLDKWSFDGTHLNTYGYKVWKNSVSSSITLKNDE